MLDRCRPVKAVYLICLILLAGLFSAFAIPPQPALADGLTITTASLPGAITSTYYSATLSASGGSGTCTWALSAGTLPAGLSLSSTGVISGTPVSAGTSSFTVLVFDTASHSATRSYTLTVSTASPSSITVTTPTLPGATVGNYYSTQLIASGGSGAYTWAVSSGSLPAGLTLTVAGLIYGTPTAAGTSSFTVQIDDGAGHMISYSFSIVVSLPAAALSITTTGLAEGTAGTPYSATLAASGGSGSYTWSSAGSLPPGLALSPAGSISGTPTTAGTYTFNISVSDNATHTAAREYTLSIAAARPAISITTASLAGGTAGTAYSAQISAAGGSGQYIFQVSSGNLPPGLTLSQAGIISGNPVDAGTYSFTITVKDTGSLTASKSFSLTIASAAPSSAQPAAPPAAASTASTPKTTPTPAGEKTEKKADAGNGGGFDFTFVFIIAGIIIGALILTRIVVLYLKSRRGEL